MRDDAQFHAGKKTASDSLEFIGAKKKSLFSQYTAQFQQKTSSKVDKQRATIEGPQYSPVQPQRSSFNYEDKMPTIKYTSEVPLPPDVEDLLDVDDDALKGVGQSRISRPQQDKDAIRAKKRQKLKVIFGSVGMLAGIAIIIVSVVFIKNNRPIVSDRFRASLGFPVYEMLNNNSFAVDKKTVARGENNSLVYIAEEKDNNSKFIISQQAIPEVLKTDAQYQDFLAQTDKFASLDSKMGKAYFTKPTNIGDDISVVVRTDSTLLFIRGSGATSEEKWTQLISLLNVTK